MKHYLGMKHLNDRIRKGEQAEAELEKRLHLIWLDRLTFGVGILGPFTALPQLWLIISTQSSAGVSLWTWLLSIFTSLIWTAYGLAHREKAIIVSGILWLILEVGIVFAIIIYP